MNGHLKKDFRAPKKIDKPPKVEMLELVRIEVWGPSSVSPIGGS